MGVDGGSYKGIQAVDQALLNHFSGHALDDIPIAAFLEEPMTEQQANAEPAEAGAADGRVYPSVSIQLVSLTPDHERGGGKQPYFFENYRGFNGLEGALGDAPDPPRVSKFDAPDHVELLYSIDWWSLDAPVDRLLLELFWSLVPDGRGAMEVSDPFAVGSTTTAWVMRQSGPFALNETVEDQKVYRRSGSIIVPWELDNRQRVDQTVLASIDRIDLTVYEQPDPAPTDILELDTSPLVVLDSDILPTF